MHEGLGVFVETIQAGVGANPDLSGLIFSQRLCAKADIIAAGAVVVGGVVLVGRKGVGLLVVFVGVVLVLGANFLGYINLDTILIPGVDGHVSAIAKHAQGAIFETGRQVLQSLRTLADLIRRHQGI